MKDWSIQQLEEYVKTAVTGLNAQGRNLTLVTTMDRESYTLTITDTDLNKDNIAVKVSWPEAPRGEGWMPSAEIEFIEQKVIVAWQRAAQHIYNYGVAGAFHESNPVILNKWI